MLESVVGDPVIVDLVRGNALVKLLAEETSKAGDDVLGEGGMVAVFLQFVYETFADQIATGLCVYIPGPEFERVEFEVGQRIAAADEVNLLTW
jgi:hypothetical protein